MGFEELDWYESPRYYDIVFDEGTEREGAFLAEVARTYGRARGRRVLEPACGSGRLLAELARRGFRVAGFDASAAMLRFARARLAREGLRARLRRARLESFALAGPFDLAHCLVNTFKYVIDEAGARAHLECVARVLAPGGVYVLGMHLSDYADARVSHERWVAERDGARVVCNIRGWPPERRRRRERCRSRLVVLEHGRVLRSETHWWFRTYDARELARLVRSVPELEHVTTFDFDYDLSLPGELDGERLDRVLVLRRRGAARVPRRGP